MQMFAGHMPEFARVCQAINGVCWTGAIDLPISSAVPKPRELTHPRTAPPRHEWIDVPNVPYRGGPKLENRRRPHGDLWPWQAIEKWDAWRSMPHCRLWTKLDWQYAFDSIELVAQLYCSSRPWQATAVQALDHRERVMGTTLDFRRALRIRYIDPPKASSTAAAVSRMADYRDL